jgi:hypothetical protein
MSGQGLFGSRSITNSSGTVSNYESLNQIQLGGGIEEEIKPADLFSNSALKIRL